MSSLTSALFAYIEANHPQALRGITEARAVDPARFNAYSEQLVGWAHAALGPDAIKRTADAFVRFSMDVNFAQARYEADGHYENKSYEECYQSVYNQKETMDDYLWGVFLTNFLWTHHLDLSIFFEDRFVAKLPREAQLIELAPGHGGWGLMALSRCTTARLKGYDISPSSAAIARALSKAARLDDRAEYTIGNALELDRLAADQADGVICNFLIEHLETPEKLVEVIAHLLKPGAVAFLSGALTAAQVDHIYEFHRESEFVLMAERNGLRVLETRSAGPSRTLPKARFLPRSMSLILQKRTKEHW